MDIIRAIEQQQINPEVADFNVGDNVKVHYRIKEGNRERIQVFQGDVIRRHGASSRETFTVRKISFSVGVERTFPVHSPRHRRAFSSLKARWRCFLISLFYRTAQDSRRAMTLRRILAAQENLKAHGAAQKASPMGLSLSLHSPESCSLFYGICPDFC